MASPPLHPAQTPYHVPHFVAPLAGGRVCNAMSIDVEDYFQVQAFDGQVRRDDWETLEWRFVANTNHILDMLAQGMTIDEIITDYPSLDKESVQGAIQEIKETFELRSGKTVELANR